MSLKIQPFFSRVFFLLTISGLFAAVGAAAGSSHYAVVLQDEPVVKTMKRTGRNSFATIAARQTILQRQAALRTQLEGMGIRVTSARHTLLNVVFVEAKESDVPKLRAMPGVRSVTPVRLRKLDLNAAVGLVNAPAAWAIFGGISNAGTGVKIAVIDTGIDNDNPAFQDPTLSYPAGYPICDVQSNCAFTNTKIIVARSYNYLEALASNDGAVDSRPDDFSARDRVGHGTSVAMAAAGNTVAAPLATITGLAPHAYLGSYKVNGSPGINDFSSSEGFTDALDDAMTDGMNVVVYSSGGVSFTGPLETGAICGENAGTACDPDVEAAENAIQSGNMVIVAAAGNGAAPGQYSTNQNVSAYDTVGSPAYAPDVIAAAATGNSHMFTQAVQVSGPSVPANVASLSATASGNLPATTLTATLVDAGSVGDPNACSAYAANALAGDIALIERGPTTNPCTFDVKVTNAENAGAVGVVLFDDISEPTTDFADIVNATIPVFQITESDGTNLKTYLDAATGVMAGLNPSTVAVAATDTNEVAYFSSRGPTFSSDGLYLLKPDVAAPGTNIYTAACSSDPNCEIYDPTGFTVENGTSYSTPIVGGIAALLVQNNAKMTALDIRSALINTATSDTTDPWLGNTVQSPSGVLSVGGGKVDALSALQTTVTADPATLSFGVLPSSFGTSSLAFTLTNVGTAVTPLTLAISETTPDANTTLALDSTAVSLAAGQTQTVHLTLSGKQSAPGIYYGAVMVTGGAQARHIPFLWLVGDGVPFNVISYTGTGDTGIVGQMLPEFDFLSLQVFDQFGVAVPNVPVTWSASGDAQVTNASAATDGNGLAGADATLGSTAGNYTFTATFSGSNTGNLAPLTFQDSATAQPTFAANGIGNAASFQLGNGIAPGSYIVMFGSALSDSTASATFTPLPIQINNVSVGFDGLSGFEAVANLNYVSPTQINAFVPWELTGQTNVQVKVNNDERPGALVSLPVVTYSPAVFVVQDPNGTNIAAALDATTGALIDSANPATPGNYISLYCNGLGPVTNQPASGDLAPSNPLATTTIQATVTIGGAAAVVQFSGLAPNFVGLYQINVQVPPGLSAGLQPVVISIGGQTAPSVNLSVN